MKYLLAAMLVAMTFSVFGNEIESDALEIDGDFKTRPVSEADKLRRYRKKLERQNELMVKRAVEKIRLKQELQLRQKLNRQLQAL